MPLPAINLVNGISVNGLGEASMDLGHNMMNPTNLMGMGGGSSGTPPPSVNQPNIHPGCIPSTGRMNSSGQVMPQNLAFTGNGGAGAGNGTGGGGGGALHQHQQTFMTNGGVMKYNNNNNSHHQGMGSLPQQQQSQQTYMHHN